MQPTSFHTRADSFHIVKSQLTRFFFFFQFHFVPHTFCGVADVTISVWLHSQSQLKGCSFKTCRPVLGLIFVKKKKQSRAKPENTGVNIIPQTDSIKSETGQHCHRQLHKATVLSLLLRALPGITAPFLLKPPRTHAFTANRDQSEMGSTEAICSFTFKGYSTVYVRADTATVIL